MLLPLGIQSLSQNHCPPSEWCMCYNWWTYLDTSLLLKACSLHKVHCWCCTLMSLRKCILPCIHHHRIIQNSSFALKSSMLCLFITLSLNPCQSLILFFYCSIILLFPECYVVEITHYLACSDWMSSLCNIHFRFLRIFSWLGSPSVFGSNIPLSVRTTIYLFICLLKDISIASRFWQL